MTVEAHTISLSDQVAALEASVRSSSLDSNGVRYDSETNTLVVSETLAQTEQSDRDIYTLYSPEVTEAEAGQIEALIAQTLPEDQLDDDIAFIIPAFSTGSGNPIETHFSPDQDSDLDFILEQADVQINAIQQAGGKADIRIIVTRNGHTRYTPVVRVERGFSVTEGDQSADFYPGSLITFDEEGGAHYLIPNPEFSFEAKVVEVTEQYKAELDAYFSVHYPGVKVPEIGELVMAQHDENGRLAQIIGGNIPYILVNQSIEKTSASVNIRTEPSVNSDSIPGTTGNMQRLQLTDENRNFVQDFMQDEIIEGGRFISIRGTDGFVWHALDLGKDAQGNTQVGWIRDDVGDIGELVAEGPATPGSPDDVELGRAPTPLPTVFEYNPEVMSVQWLTQTYTQNKMNCIFDIDLVNGLQQYKQNDTPTDEILAPLCQVPDFSTFKFNGLPLVDIQENDNPYNVTFDVPVVRGYFTGITRVDGMSSDFANGNSVYVLNYFVFLNDKGDSASLNLMLAEAPTGMRYGPDVRIMDDLGTPTGIPTREAAELYLNYQDIYRYWSDPARIGEPVNILKFETIKRERHEPATLVPYDQAHQALIDIFTNPDMFSQDWPNGLNPYAERTYAPNGTTIVNGANWSIFTDK